MKTKLLIPALLLSGMATFSNAAMADNDELAGALIGAGAGAIIGDSVNHRDGAIVGGFLGAVLGAAIADNDDDRRPYARHYSRPYYGQPPVVVYPAPRFRYAPPSYGWGHDRHEYRDGRWDRDHDRGRDNRGGRWDRDDDRRGDRDGRRGW
jgi:hypothetical protein